MKKLEFDFTKSKSIDVEEFMKSTFELEARITHLEHNMQELGKKVSDILDYLKRNDSWNYWVPKENK